MKSIIVSLAVAAGLMVAGSAMAAAPAAAKGCKACHSIDSDKKVVGPGWVAVGKKYAGDKDGASKIAANITKGGKFDWKFGMMPPKGGNAKLSDADIKEIATYIAGLK
ncbi:MAG: cytochrome C [Gallionellaceae bacterium CG1_02_56_997]|nr:cytochrome c [Gallionella sp.]OIO82563.1 MAG: cytochrome C [Gallionellaceae bacterium CG1_02_56_997]